MGDVAGSACEDELVRYAVTGKEEDDEEDEEDEEEEDSAEEEVYQDAIKDELRQEKIRAIMKELHGSKDLDLLHRVVKEMREATTYTERGKAMNHPTVYGRFRMRNFPWANAAHSLVAARRQAVQVIRTQPDKLKVLHDFLLTFFDLLGAFDVVTQTAVVREFTTAVYFQLVGEEVLKGRLTVPENTEEMSTWSIHMFFQSPSFSPVSTRPMTQRAIPSRKRLFEPDDDDDNPTLG